MTYSDYLLMLAIATVWLPPLNWRARSWALWPLPFVLALGLAWAEGRILPVGLAGIGLLWLCAARRWWLPAAVLALALALHRWPGFTPALLIAPQQLAPDSLPFSLYANLDKGSAGLLLLAFFCPRTTSLAQWRGVLRLGGPLLWLTPFAIMAVAWAVGLVHPDFKWPAMTGTFLALNLAFTVVAEEAFFRGLLHQRLLHWRWPAAAISVISALLFGLAHLGGGLPYAALATLAGLAYALARVRSASIEAPIALHFLLNALHFLCFSYPLLK